MVVHIELIALPADLRPRYVAHLRGLVPVGAPSLVITFEYDQQRMTGPPLLRDLARGPLRGPLIGVSYGCARSAGEVSRESKARKEAKGRRRGCPG